LKDAAKLLAYLAATLLFGALVAPPLYWAVEAANTRGWLTFLAQFDFEKFFHRALLIGALVFLWPLIRSLGIGAGGISACDRTPNRWRDAAAGFAIAGGPALLLRRNPGAPRRLFSARDGFAARAAGAIRCRVVVPFLEEPLFRGLILGVLLRAGAPIAATLATSAFFSIVHFLKAPENTTTDVTWSSGFVSIAHSFHQFQQPMLVLAGFTTLFLLGCILADARLRTGSLWLPIGLHGGWIFANAIFSKVARREFEALPWIGRNLLIGIAPLCVALLSWALVRAWLRHVERAET
jgi:membrane protease YdiL (CAAX protease family)